MINIKIDVKEVTLSDVNKLQHLSRTTFADTFGNDNTEADLNSYLDEAYNLQQLTAELNNPDSKFYFVTVNDEIAGYLKLNVGTAQSEPEGAMTLEVQRIYILSDFKRRGLGTILIKYAIDQAKALNKTVIWLGVWEHNQPALKFYKKMGFKEFSDHIFQVGNDKQRDILMKKSLN